MNKVFTSVRYIEPLGYLIVMYNELDLENHLYLTIRICYYEEGPFIQEWIHPIDEYGGLNKVIKYFTGSHMRDDVDQIVRFCNIKDLNLMLRFLGLRKLQEIDNHG